MQGCLSITREQMGAVAFVSSYPTRQLSCGTRAGVDQARAGAWEVGQGPHGPAACLAPTEGASDVVSFWRGWKLPFMAVICLGAVGHGDRVLLSAWQAGGMSV